MLSHDGKKSIIILSILTVITTVFCILRWIPRRQKNLLGADDWLLAFALLMLYVQDAGAFLRMLISAGIIASSADQMTHAVAIKGGMGKPIRTLTPDEVEWLFKVSWYLFDFPIAKLISFLPPTPTDVLLARTRLHHPDLHDQILHLGVI